MSALDLAADVTGFDELLEGIERVGVSARTALGGALFLEGSGILSLSQQQYVPVQYGALRNSGVVMVPVWDGNTVRVVLGFGGAASAYALAVHEHLSAHSPRSWKTAEAAGHPVQFSHGGPKYLERPFVERASDLTARVGERIKTAIEQAAVGGA